MLWTIYNYNMIYNYMWEGLSPKPELLEETRVHTVLWLKIVLAYKVQKGNR